MNQDKVHGALATYFEEHPRMMGALFTICLLLMQAGNVAANMVSTNNGP